MQSAISKSRALQGERWIPAAFQKVMTRWLVAHPEAALFADPGLRKTSSTLAAFRALQKARGAHRALVIAPKRVCELVWSQDGEVGKWQDFNHMSVVFVHGDRKAQLLEQDADLYVMNPEGLDWLCRCPGCDHPPHAGGKCDSPKCACAEKHSTRIKPLLKRGVDTLIVDELSAFKHPDTKRFKLLRPWLGYFRRRWGLTGSPAANGLIDLFGQVFILDLGRALGPFITHYRHEYFLPTGFGGFKWKIQEGAEKKIYRKLKNLALSMRAEDHLDLPQLVEQDMYVVLPDKAQLVYESMEEELIAYLAQGTITAANAAVASSKCRQITSGAVYADNAETIAGAKKRKVHHLHAEKVEALSELVAELQGNPLLVVYEFQHELKRIREALGDVPAINGQTSSADTLAYVKAWNAGKLPVLCGQPQSMGHGLNLQACGHHLCWFTIPWNQEIYDQTNKRLHRSGQQHRVFAHRLLARGTVDEIVAKALTSKKRVQDALLAALKGRSYHCNVTRVQSKRKSTN
jgi:hypothetical protein